MSPGWTSQLAAPYYDAVNHTFPWRYAWLSKYFVHRYLKYALLIFGLAIWGIALSRAGGRIAALPIAAHGAAGGSSHWRSVAGADRHRVLRHSSAMHCPWDITDFGGYSPYFDLLSPTPPVCGPGVAFPAGFIATGAWLLAFGLLWYPRAQVAQLHAWLAALAVAFGLGWVQQMRGAHFLSHTLWSLWVGWAVMLAVARTRQATVRWRIDDRSRASRVDA